MTASIPDDRERVAALAHEARQQGIPTRCEFRFVARDGRIVWVLDQTIPVRDEAGTIVCHQGFLLDITEQKQLEEQLRQSQKMEAIGQLAGGIAHDFNNMLTAISGYAELLACSFDEGDPRADDVDQVRKAAAHAAALTRQLLTFSRKQVLLPQRLDVERCRPRPRGDARPHDRRRDRAEDLARRRARVRGDRSGPARADRAQHGDQRPRRDAERRQS